MKKIKNKKKQIKLIFKNQHNLMRLKPGKMLVLILMLLKLSIKNKFKIKKNKRILLHKIKKILLKMIKKLVKIKKKKWRKKKIGNNRMIRTNKLFNQFNKLKNWKNSRIKIMKITMAKRKKFKMMKMRLRLKFKKKLKNQLDLFHLIPFLHS